MNRQAINRFCFLLPIALSLAALGMVISALVLGWANPEPDGDEGVAAHIFQLLIVTQAPFIAAYVFTADWTRKAKPLYRLAILMAAIAAALAPVYFAGL